MEAANGGSGGQAGEERVCVRTEMQFAVGGTQRTTREFSGGTRGRLLPVGGDSEESHSQVSLGNCATHMTDVLAAHLFSSFRL